MTDARTALRATEALLRQAGRTRVERDVLLERVALALWEMDQRPHHNDARAILAGDIDAADIDLGDPATAETLGHIRDRVKESLR